MWRDSQSTSCAYRYGLLLLITWASTVMFHLSPPLYQILGCNLYTLLQSIIIIIVKFVKTACSDAEAVCIRGKKETGVAGNWTQVTGLSWCSATTAQLTTNLSIFPYVYHTGNTAICHGLIPGTPLNHAPSNPPCVCLLSCCNLYVICIFHDP